MATRARAYVDGFNLYRSLLIHHPEAKWLDFTALWDAWFDDFKIEQTYYFTARVRALPLDRGAPARQRRYLDALATLGPQLEVVFGNFREDRVMRRPTSGSPRDRVEVWQNREKGSDVNLASYLLRDVYRDSIDLAVVVTNDADLVPPIQFARDAGKEVIVCNPGRETGRAIKQTEAQIFRLTASRAVGAQFPRTLTDANGHQIQRPREWR